MSITLPAIDLSSAAVGATGTVDWSKYAPQAGYAAHGGTPHLAAYNESGCGLQLSFSTGEQAYLPAGGWVSMALNPACQNFTYQVVYSLTAPLVTKLLVVWFPPEETVPPTPILGNSPVGGALTNTMAQTLQGAGQTFALTEEDSSGTAPALVPTSGVGTDLVLSARNNAGSRVDMVTLDAVNARMLLGGTNSLAVGTGVSSTYARVNESGSAPGVLALRSASAGASALGSVFVGWDGSFATIPFSVGGQFSGAACYVSNTGAIGAVAGQATAGSFGVPAIVAQVTASHVTATGFQVVLDYLTPSLGPGGALYRVGAYVFMGNGSNANLQIQVAWNDGTNGFPQTQQMSNGAQVFNGSTLITTNKGYAMQAVTIWAQGPSHIQVGINDPTGTPNDYLTAIIERLA